MDEWQVSIGDLLQHGSAVEKRMAAGMAPVWLVILVEPSITQQATLPDFDSGNHVISCDTICV